MTPIPALPLGRINQARSSRLLSGLMAGALALLVTARSREAHAGSPICTSVSHLVALAPGLPAVHEIVGELCVPPGSTRDTVLLTVSGATYTHVYWDFPYQPETYSFVRHANAAGYATLNFDRLGNGGSAHPPSLAVIPTAEAYAHHQLVEALRSGEFGHAWSRVVLAGHSLGSIISIQQAATYHDVDGVVVTGFMHLYGLGLVALLANLQPAAADPAFAPLGLDLGYLTTKPNVRGSTFYYLDNADPAVVALDEQTKGLGTAGELAQFALVDTALTSLQVKVPVLSVVGRYDTVFCGLTPCDTPLIGASTLERLAYAPAAKLKIVVVPDAGHDLNLQKNAPTTYAAILGWLNARFPPLGI